MKARKVYEFVNPRARNFKNVANIGEIKQIKETALPILEEWDIDPKYCEFTMMEGNPTVVINTQINITTDYLGIGDIEIHTWPADYMITESIHIESNSLDSMPKYLIVRGDLKIESNYNIRELPKEYLDVQGDLEISNCGLVDATDLIKYRIKGSIKLPENDITVLPDNLKVNGDLHLSGNKKLSKMPSGLKIEGDLYLVNTSVEIIPDDTEIGGYLYIDRYMPSKSFRITDPVIRKKLQMPEEIRKYARII